MRLQSELIYKKETSKRGNLNKETTERGNLKKRDFKAR